MPKPASAAEKACRSADGTVVAWKSSAFEAVSPCYGAQVAFLLHVTVATYGTAIPLLARTVRMLLFVTRTTTERQIWPVLAALVSARFNRSVSSGDAGCVACRRAVSEHQRRRSQPGRGGGAAAPPRLRPHRHTSRRAPESRRVPRKRGGARRAGGASARARRAHLSQRCLRSSHAPRII